MSDMTNWLSTNAGKCNKHIGNNQQPNGEVFPQWWAPEFIRIAPPSVSWQRTRIKLNCCSKSNIFQHYFTLPPVQFWLHRWFRDVPVLFATKETSRNSLGTSNQCQCQVAPKHGELCNASYTVGIGIGLIHKVDCINCHYMYIHIYYIFIYVIYPNQ